MSRLCRDRAEAGHQVAVRLSAYAGRPDVVVLALPRGGVPVACAVARALGAPLDVFLVRTLGVPGLAELALGAIASGGGRVLNEEVVRGLHIAPDTSEAVAAREAAELARRERAYRDDRPRRRAVLAPVTIRTSMLCFVKRGMRRERVIGGGVPLWTVRAVAGGCDVMATIFGLLTKRAAATLRVVHARRLRWTKPATRTPVRGALADVTRSTAALVAENALLRQQLLVLQRTVTRPAVRPRDRVLLVRLARLVRGWQAALLIVQPDTLLRGHRHGYRRVWRARSVTAAQRP